MPRSFAITAASNSVFLDEDRKGEARFTVSNQSGRSIEGRARVVAEDAEAEPWISLRGSAHRVFSTAGTEQYTAEIEVPPDAPSGNYTVRLDMVGEERPDEQYVEGPSVTFQVPEPEPDSEPFPWKIVAAIVAVLLIGGGVLAYAIFSDTDEADTTEADTAVVPDVAGLTPGQATDSMQAAGFRLWDLREEHNDSVAQNRVIGTDPAAQAQAITDSSVVLRISLGPAIVTIPPVDSASFMEAINLLNERGLTPTALSAENHSSIPENYAIGTDPAAGEEVQEGTELTLIVSSGPSNTGGGFDPGEFEIPPGVLNDQVLQPGQTIQLNQHLLKQQITDSLQVNQPNP